MKSKDKFHIILGTAHLGTTPGKCSPDKKFREPIWSREIIERIKKELEELGWQVHVDIPSLDPPKGVGSTYWKTEQSRELQWRVNYVNSLCRKYGPAECLYLSVHVNGAGNGGQWLSARGWSAYTTKGRTKSDMFAECLYQEADIQLKDYIDNFPKGGKQRPIREDKTDGDRDLESDFYVIKKTACPAVLTENLFQDNKEDVDFLTSEKGKEALVKLHVNGILKFIEKL